MRARRIFSVIMGIFCMSAILLSVSAEAQMQQVKARENFMNLWLLRMTQVLNLTEEQTAKIYPAVHRNEKDKMEIQKETGKKIMELKLALSKEKPENQELESLMSEIKKLSNLVKTKEQELENFIEKNLTLEQRARYIVFAVEFMRGMRERLENSRVQPRRLPEGRRFQK